jgi:hypothetical protein
MEVPPRVDGERARTDASIAAVLEKLTAERDRPSLVHVFAPTPARRDLVSKAIGRLRARRVPVHWSLPAIEESVGLPRDSSSEVSRASDAPRGIRGAASSVAPARSDRVLLAVEEAVRVRVAVDRARGTELLRRMGAVVTGPWAHGGRRLQELARVRGGA